MPYSVFLTVNNFTTQFLNLILLNKRESHKLCGTFLTFVVRTDVCTLNFSVEYCLPLATFSSLE
jgi:hypothetical protein